MDSIEPNRQDHGYLLAEFVLAVVAVTGALLGVACKSVSYDLVSHPAISDYAYCNVVMFND